MGTRIALYLATDFNRLKTNIFTFIFTRRTLNKPARCSVEYPRVLVYGNYLFCELIKLLARHIGIEWDDIVFRTSYDRPNATAQ